MKLNGTLRDVASSCTDVLVWLTVVPAQICCMACCCSCTDMLVWLAVVPA
jgi:hypothetical protein